LYKKEAVCFISSDMG